MFPGQLWHFVLFHQEERIGRFQTRMAVRSLILATDDEWTQLMNTAYYFSILKLICWYLLFSSYQYFSVSILSIPLNSMQLGLVGLTSYSTLTCPYILSTRKHDPFGPIILALSEGFLGPSAHLRGLWPLFWGPVALISGCITLMISYLDCPAWVHTFRHQKLYCWSIFGHNSSDCVKSVWRVCESVRKNVWKCVTI